MKDYMYSSISEDVEVKRLVGLNDLHNKHSMSYIAPLVEGVASIKVLELGCGNGTMRGIMFYKFLLGVKHKKYIKKLKR